MWTSKANGPRKRDLPVTAGARSVQGVKCVFLAPVSASRQEGDAECADRPWCVRWHQGDGGRSDQPRRQRQCRSACPPPHTSRLDSSSGVDQIESEQSDSCRHPEPFFGRPRGCGFGRRGFGRRRFGGVGRRRIRPVRFLDHVSAVHPSTPGAGRPLLRESRSSCRTRTAPGIFRAPEEKRNSIPVPVTHGHPSPTAARRHGPVRC